MKTADLSAVTALYAHFNEAGDARAVLEQLHPDVSWTTDPDGFDPGGTYTGKTAVEAYINGLLSAFEEVHVEPVESVTLGEDRLLVRTEVYGRVFFSQAVSRFEWCHLWTIAGGMIVAVQTFLDWERARQVSGASDEHPPGVPTGVGGSASAA
ncbi:MAG: hypothetical protein NVSMB51_08030 [Solirubrobacteraceae bacterium]